MIGVRIEGRERVVARIRNTSPRIQNQLRLAVAAATIELANHIKAQKLSGQVLNVRSGTLRRAVRAYPPSETVGTIRGVVAVDGPASVYGRVHEYGGTRAYEIRPIRAKVLRFMAGGSEVFARSVMHPSARERSFMRSALDEKREQIAARLRRAVAVGLGRGNA